MTDGVVAMVGHMTKWQAEAFWIVRKDLSRRLGGGIRDAIYSPWCHVKHVLVMKSGVNNLLIHDRNISHDLTLTSLYEHSVLFSGNRKMAFSRPLPGSGIFSTGKLQGLVPWNKNAQRSNTAGNQLLRWNKATSWKVKLSEKCLGKVLLFYQKSITRQEKRRRFFQAFLLIK